VCICQMAVLFVLIGAFPADISGAVST